MVRFSGWMILAALSWPMWAQVRYGVDLRGMPVTKLDGPGTRVVVLYFAASDCPVSNRYLPEISRLRREFAAQGAEFWQVYPNPGDTAAVVRRHSTEFADAAPVVLDTEQTLTQMAHASITPEAAVLVSGPNGLREVYHGRIDDRYLDLGTERPRAFHHDLEDAISAALAGKPVPQPGGSPVGCAIVTRQR